MGVTRHRRLTCADRDEPFVTRGNGCCADRRATFVRGLITFKHAREDVKHMVLPVFVRRLLLVAWDVASWLLAFLMFAWLRYKDSLTHEQWVSGVVYTCLLYTSPSPRDGLLSRMPSSA